MKLTAKDKADLRRILGKMLSAAPRWWVRERIRTLIATYAGLPPEEAKRGVVGLTNEEHESAFAGLLFS